VFLTNVALTTLALISVLAGRVLVSVLTLCAAAVLVTALLASFARIKRKQ